MVGALDCGSAGPDLGPSLCHCVVFVGKTPYTRCVPGIKNGYRRIYAGGNPGMYKHPNQGGIEILLVASCYKNRHKLPDGPLGSYADYTFLPSLLQFFSHTP